MNNQKLDYLSQFYDRGFLNNYMKDNIELFNRLYIDMQPCEYNILDLHDSVDKWVVDSPDGFVPVEKLISKGSYEIYRTEFTDGTYVNSSGLHCFENTFGGWISPINIVPGHKLKSKNGYKEVARVTNSGIEDLVFDLVVNSDNHRYYTNGISSHNSGAGKSLFLQNLGVNWAMNGLNVVYLSLELSEKLCAMRIDAMHTGYETREVMRNIDDVHMKIRASQQKSQGSLRIKQMPNGCTTNDIRAFIKEYEIHSGKKVDAILVDYLDLMSPMSKKISAENLFVKDKYVTEELRNLAVELNMVTVSASQLNRCLSPDTLVEIDGVGMIEIKEVAVGDKILSETGYNTILDKWTNKQHVYKIKTASGKEIICSANHRFPVENGINSIEHGLTIGDHLYIKNDE